MVQKYKNSPGKSTKIAKIWTLKLSLNVPNYNAKLLIVNP